MLNHIEIFRTLLKKLNNATRYSEQWSVSKEDQNFQSSETSWYLYFTYYKSKEKCFLVIYRFDLVTKKLYVNHLGKEEEIELSPVHIGEFFPLLESLYRLYTKLVHNLLLEAVDEL